MVIVLQGTLRGLVEQPWLGVEVCGRNDFNQYANSGEFFQGRFLGKTGGVIENAVTRLKMFGPDSETSSGGIVSCGGVTFRNNITGGDIQNCQNFYPPGSPLAGNPNYSARFTDCSFVNNQQYPHTDNFQSFVNLVEVNGPLFRGCAFTNSTTYEPPHVINAGSYGRGIFTSDASVRVLPKCLSTAPCSSYQHSTFSNLSYGILSSSIISADAPLVVSRADFDKCFVGIWNSGNNAPSITDCLFELGEVPDLAVMSDQMGIHLSSSITGFTVVDNRFVQDHTPEGLLTTGISCFNVGTSNKSINLNEFYGVDIANRAAGICGNEEQGLLYECNQNETNTLYDFLVCDHERTSADRIRPVQISAVNQSVSDIFSNTGTPNDRDFANQGGFQTDYFYPLNGSTNVVPDEYSGLLIDDADPNECSTENCPPPCFEEGLVQQMRDEFYQNREDY